MSRSDEIDSRLRPRQNSIGAYKVQILNNKKIHMQRNRSQNYAITILLMQDIDAIFYMTNRQSE